MVAGRLMGWNCLLAIPVAWCLILGDQVQGAEPSPREQVAAGPVDIGAFARVVTSNPKHTQGTSATRLEAFPAEDVFLDTDVKPADDGSYAVPTMAEGQGCIGLRWNEPRLLRRLELMWADPTAVPPVEAVQLQYWVGESPWQGEWKVLPAQLNRSKARWSWTINEKEAPQRTLRVRWIIPTPKGNGTKPGPFVLKRIAAFGRLSWRMADLQATWWPSTESAKSPIEPARVEVYNGVLMSPSGLRRTWSLVDPLALKVRYSEPAAIKAERTVLRFEMPRRTVSVAVEDVLKHGCVYVPSSELFVSGGPRRKTPAEYMQQIAGRQTVLEEVRGRPDRTLADAMATVHNPIQNWGPTLLSLACDNRKFVAQRDGAIRFRLYDAPDAEYRSLISRKKYKPHYSPHPKLVAQFGRCKGRLTRRLDGGWLPKPVITVSENGVKYEQCTYVAPVDSKPPQGSPSWYRNRAVCVADYTIENTINKDVEVLLQVGLEMSQRGKLPLDAFHQVDGGLVAVKQGRVVALFETDETGSLRMSKRGESVVLTGKLPAEKRARLVVYLPAWPIKPADYAVLREPSQWATQFKQYWTDLLAGTIRVDVPDPFLSNVIRASQVHCLIAARNEKKGRYVAPWIDSMLYGPLDSEAQAVIHGMDLCGHPDFARRGLEFFLKRYNAQGFFTTGYTKIGTGEHLWTLAAHYDLYGDREWLKAVSPTLARAGKWIASQRTKTKRLNADGNRVPQYGLMPPDATADCGRLCYRFFNEAQYYFGLKQTALILTDIGHPDAPALLAEAKSYHEDLLRAYRWLEARSPVVLLRDGTWIPNPPADMNLLGNVEDMLVVYEPDKMMIYNAEIGPNHLITDGILDPRSPRAAEIMDYLEDHQFLRSGHKDFPEQKNRQDAFAFGGFGKVQPYYGRNAEVCLLRDDPKPFVRSYFNAMSSLVGTENLTFWEHFRNTGGWNKTHETAWFLVQTAKMFTADRNGDLWLAPMITNRWLENGKTISVRNAPTRFGKVSYSITSSSAAGHIDAVIEPLSSEDSARPTPKRIVLRIRHPEGKPMRAVTVNGKPHTDFNAGKELIRIPPAQNRVQVRVTYH
ncbi:MAG: hypothetical protein JW818_19870 [Pirellulales bacterium]|nr:hypothetical protein [Pirellulales bacterium]